MLIDGKIITATGDNPGQRNPRTPPKPSVPVREQVEPAIVITGSYDPSSRVSLSAETLLFLSRTRRAPEKYPPLTREEWGNTLTPQLAAREYQAFGKFGETGDYKAYYRAFIDYYDTLRPDDQNSIRYFGTREAAVAGLRSTDYDDESGLPSGQFQTLVNVLLDGDFRSDPPAASDDAQSMTTGDMFGWEGTSISYEEPGETGAALSEIEKFYRESF